MWHATHPLLPFGSNTQLEYFNFVSVCFDNFLMGDFVVAVDDVKLEEKFVKESCQGFGKGRPRCSPAFGWGLQQV